MNDLNTVIDLTLYIAGGIFIVLFLIVCTVATYVTIHGFGWKSLFLNIPIYVLCAGKLTFIWLLLWVIGYFVKQL